MGSDAVRSDRSKAGTRSTAPRRTESTRHRDELARNRRGIHSTGRRSPQLSSDRHRAWARCRLVLGGRRSPDASAVRLAEAGFGGVRVCPHGAETRSGGLHQWPYDGQATRANPQGDQEPCRPGIPDVDRGGSGGGRRGRTGGAPGSRAARAGRRWARSSRGGVHSLIGSHVAASSAANIESTIGGTSTTEEGRTPGPPILDGLRIVRNR